MQNLLYKIQLLRYNNNKRTETVTLTTIEAVAFRQKLKTSGAGIIIMRYDIEQPGIASISKTSGKAIPTDNTPLDLYPVEAFNEAIKLTAGMPYKKRSGVRLAKKKIVEVAPAPTEEIAEEVVVDTAEYQSLSTTIPTKTADYPMTCSIAI